MDMEPALGAQTTGRSAALVSTAFKPPVIRELTMASLGFFADPPPGFSEVSLLPRRPGRLMIAGGNASDSLERIIEGEQAPFPMLSPAEALELCPVLRQEYQPRAVFDPECYEIDVHALISGYERQIKARSSFTMLDSKVRSLTRRGENWYVGNAAGVVVAAPVIINAAGAWGDGIARMAGVPRLGLQPELRSACTVPLPPDVHDDTWPFVVDVSQGFWFKKEGGQVMTSLSGGRSVPPAEPKPEPLDIAQTLDLLGKVSTLESHHVKSSWAGLVTFLDDERPAAGFDVAAAGFFWLVGQGSAGIMTAPALSRAAAALVTGSPLPADLIGLGVTERALSPHRFATPSTL